MKKEKKVVLITLVTFLLLAITGFTSFEFINSNPLMIPIQNTLQETVRLESAAEFAVLAGTSVTNIGKTSIIGEIGVSPGSWEEGFSQKVLVWTKQIDFNKLTHANLDLFAAYEDAEGRKSVDMVKLNGNIGGLTLTPGLYHSHASIQISKGDLTFDALGRPNSIFIIQIESRLNTRPETRVILKGGAVASNIFWQVGNSATFGSNSVFKGTIMAQKTIKFCSGASLEGRGFSKAGEVILASNKITNQ